ncbi:hypothetical protein MMC07_005010 [Pseudocyphellaria aurata]|nr:hypothetical protein [Pseudocyphellaria aurata]
MDSIGAEGEEKGSLCSDNEEISDDDSYFYEKPDWVKDISFDRARELSQQNRLFCSPLHYSVKDLEVSARNGCHLCSLFWDQLLHNLKNMTKADEAKLQQAKGLIIVRPRPNPLEGNTDRQAPQSLVLAVSYFVDGNCERQSSYILSLEFDIYVTDSIKDCFPQLLPSTPRIPNRTIDDIRVWVADCLSNHLECQKHVQVSQPLPELRRLPTRLLNVSLPDPCLVTLTETTNFDPTTRYMTLSHCWGDFLPVRLLGNLYESFKEGLLIDQLPKTFQDAIKFTRALQVRYLWIDALCIIQDSVVDWLRESLLMSSVYSNSWLNLAATASTNGHGGLFRSRNFLLSSPCTVTASWEGFAPGSYTVLDGSTWTRRVEESPLNKRAWVLQERLLAPRTAHFAYDQVFWECRQIVACETFPLGAPEYSPNVVDFLKSISVENLIDSNGEWLNWVKEYTKKSLTKDSDKLVAIAGLATHARRKLSWSEDDYVAGLWRHDLAVDLLWRAAGVGTKIPIYVAPSWSWASINGEIYFHSSDTRNVVRNNLTIKILSIVVSPVGGGMGPVGDGYLTVQGPLHRIHLSQPDLSVDNYPCLQKLKIGVTEFYSHSTFEESLDDDSWYHQWHPRNNKTIFCRFMTAPTPHLEEAFMSEGLIIEPVGEECGKYRRIGWLRIFMDDPQIVFAEKSTADELTPEEYITRNDASEYTFTII